MPYRRGDRDACARIYLEGRRAIFPALAGAFALEDFDALATKEDVLVGREDRPCRVAGFVSFRPADAFVHALYVDAALERRGVGRRLLDVALGHLPRPAWLNCVVANEPARAFYERLGWREQWRVLGPRGECVLFRKD